MLVLSRKAAETIIIDNRIQLTVLKAKRGVVRIGIDAPKDIHVVRGELCQAEARLTPGAASTARLSPSP